MVHGSIAFTLCPFFFVDLNINISYLVFLWFPDFMNIENQKQKQGLKQIFQ
jgi:hypothetical protein